jgi:hypothetical protein
VFPACLLREAAELYPIHLCLSQHIGLVFRRIEKRQPDGAGASALYGITGTFRISFAENQGPEPEFPTLAFDLYPVVDLQVLAKDVLQVKDLFFLSIGFLKLDGNQ